MRSGVLVSGDTSQQNGTSCSFAPSVFSATSSTRSSNGAASRLGVPPPMVTRENDAFGSAAETMRASRSSVPTKRSMTGSSGPATVKRLQKPQRISQNGTCM